MSSDETSRHRKNMLSINYKYFVGSLEDNTLETRTSFAAIRQLPDGTAKSVFSACREQERRDGLPIATLAVYCADGANVISGCKQGVAIQIKNCSRPVFLLTVAAIKVLWLGRMPQTRCLLFCAALVVCTWKYLKQWCINEAAVSEAVWQDNAR